MIVTVALEPKQIKKFFEIYGYKSDAVDPKIDAVCQELIALDGADLDMTDIRNVVGKIARQEFNRAAIWVGETDGKHQLAVQMYDHYNFHAIGIRIVEEGYKIRICENLRAKTFEEI